ncbi:hypothetical protein KUCAC02_021089 [Chaenocephalus aceratus]|uniref:Uncharacterized protein n=1 Tax=Chaenocephalus aceratus TaxID=36190 RepID=A0ACB9XEF6_CHAAC|nr:hypothetical protein KUCAC02_021089 [Chaenocephalus aceratus]
MLDVSGARGIDESRPVIAIRPIHRASDNCEKTHEQEWRKIHMIIA